MSAYIPVELQRQTRSRFADCCAYCQCLACPSCNRYKAVRQTATDPTTQAEVPLFHLQQQSWDDHFE